MKNIFKAKIFYYYYDISKKEDLKKYNLLKEKLKKEGLKLFDSISLSDYKTIKAFFDKIKELEKKGYVEIDSDYLFNNQYNTTEKSFNLRVFDWSEEIYSNRDIKEGYYLIIPEELKKLKENTFKCGYCGEQYLKEEIKQPFCYKCLGSEFLTYDNLLLLRLKSIMDNSGFKPLTLEEEKILIHLYEKTQKEARKKRLEENIKRKKASLKKDLENAKKEYKGFMWLIDNNINYDNVIYYNHSDIFCFGWKNKLSFKEEQNLKEKLKGFPYAYELKV